MQFTLGLPEVLAIMTPLTGLITWLGRELLKSKNDQIAAAWRQADQERIEKELYRNELLATKRTAEKSVDINERLADTVTRRKP